MIRTNVDESGCDDTADSSRDRTTLRMNQKKEEQDDNTNRSHDTNALPFPDSVAPNVKP